MASSFKENQRRIRSFNWYQYVVNGRKDIRGETSHSIYRCAKANNKYIKDYAKFKESSYLQYCDINNLYGWAMSQTLPVKSFEWIKDTSQFKEDFIENYIEGYFLKVDVQYSEKSHERHNDLPFLPERMKIEKSKSL